MNSNSNNTKHHLLFTNGEMSSLLTVQRDMCKNINKLTREKSPEIDIIIVTMKCVPGPWESNVTITVTYSCERLDDSQRKYRLNGSLRQHYKKPERFI